MITAILYTSNTGFTKQYAEMLAEATGLPAYNIKNSIPPAVNGQEVVFMGWMMAGNVQGFKKICTKYNVKALCAVGMAPASQDQTEEITKKYGLQGARVFYLQGGFDMKKLTGVYKFMMQVMCKKIIGDMEKVAERTPEQEALYKMATEGMSCVSAENLQPVADWVKSNQ